MGNKKVLSLVLAGIIGAGSCLPAMAGNTNGDDAVNPNGDGTASISVGLSGEENKSSQTTEEQKEVPPPTKKRKIEKSDKDSSNKETSVMEEDGDDDDDSETEGEEDGIDFSWMNADYKDDNGKPNYNKIKELFSANIRFTRIQRSNIDHTICNALIKVLYMHNRKTLSDKSKSTNEHKDARKKTITEYEKITKGHNECTYTKPSTLIGRLYAHPKAQNNLLSILVKLMDMTQEENKSMHTQLQNDIQQNIDTMPKTPTVRRRNAAQAAAQRRRNAAQAAAQRIRNAAQDEAKKIRNEAQAAAQQIINAAQTAAQQIRSNAEAAARQQPQQIYMLQQQPQQYQQQQMMPQQQYQQFHMQQQQPQPQTTLQQYQQIYMLQQP